jgi:NAD(P)-dependent dehydrogenase (short-subunit alcohol dehydrogenase family)
MKVAVIGASPGIGAGLAGAFRGAGYRVVATSRSIPASDEPDFVGVRGDIAEPETAQRVVEHALGRFGRIDSLVNNAGIFISKPFTDYTRGHIVNITASLGDDANSSSPSALTSLTKGGLAAVTRSLATEYASRGVRVNAVAPGVIKNPAYDEASYESMAGPVGRIGEIGDIVDAILYLEQATFVTGETLHVDGGQAAVR